MVWDSTIAGRTRQENTYDLLRTVAELRSVGVVVDGEDQVVGDLAIDGRQEGEAADLAEGGAGLGLLLASEAVAQGAEDAVLAEKGHGAVWVRAFLTFGVGLGPGDLLDAVEGFTDLRLISDAQVFQQRPGGQLHGVPEALAVLAPQLSLADEVEDGERHSRGVRHRAAPPVDDTLRAGRELSYVGQAGGTGLPARSPGGCRLPGGDVGVDVLRPPAPVDGLAAARTPWADKLNCRRWEPGVSVFELADPLGRHAEALADQAVAEISLRGLRAVVLPAAPVGGDGFLAPASADQALLVDLDRVRGEPGVLVAELGDASVAEPQQLFGHADGDVSLGRSGHRPALLPWLHFANLQDTDAPVGSRLREPAPHCCAA